MVAHILRLHCPFTIVCIELCAHDYSLKCAVFAQVQNLVYMIKVRSKLMPVWVVSSPMPGRLINVLHRSSQLPTTHQLL